MFTRYWRNYPWFLQLFLFAMMILIFASLGSYLILAAVPQLTGYSVNDLLKVHVGSTLRLIRVSLVTNGINNLFVFALPPLLFAYFTHPRPAQYLGLRAPGRPVHWLLVAGVMLGFLPVSLFLESWLMKTVNLGAGAKAQQDINDQIFAAYLSLRSGKDMLLAFIALAIIPPIGEELLFRGVLVRFAHASGRMRLQPFAKAGAVAPQRRKRAMLMPVLLSAVLFALMHSNPYGRIFIFMAGVLLALMYWLTGSLLVSIWGHFLFNGIQLLLSFLQQAPQQPSGAATTDLPVWAPLAGIVVFALSGYLLLRYKTPLPPDWSEDYDADERAANELS